MSQDSSNQLPRKPRTDLHQAQEALRQSESRYRDLFENAPVCIFEVDAVSTPPVVIQANRKASEVYGWRHDELVGRNAYELFDVSRWSNSDKVLEAVASGKTYTSISLNVRKDGTKFRVRLSITGVPGTGGRRIIAMMEDITEQEQDRQALEQSQLTEKLLRERITALHEVAVELSRTETVDSLCSRAVELGREKLGLDRLGLWFLTDYPSVIRGSYGIDEHGRIHDEKESLLPVGAEQPLAQLRQRPSPLWLKPDSALYDDKLNEVGHGSRAIAALWDGQQTIGYLMFDNLFSRRPYDEGYLEVIKLFAADIGQLASRNRVLERLRQSEERYRGLVESQNDLIVRMDPDGTFTYVNDAYCRKFGKTREELLGHTFMPLVHPDDQAAAAAAIATLARPPHRIRIVQRAMTCEGYRWLEWEDNARLDAAGNITEITGVGRDITDRKQAEQALANMHSQLLSAREDERRRLARDLHDSLGQRMIAMGCALRCAIGQLATPPGGLTELPRQVEDLVHEIRQICHGLYPPTLESLGLPRSLRQLAEECRAKVHVELEVQPAIESMRFGRDAEIALYRIAQEAMQNALRHSHARRIELRLSLDDGLLAMAVEDDGQGFDVQRASGGMGLGTMLQRARALGGDVSISSKPGRTRIISRLPMPKD